MRSIALWCNGSTTDFGSVRAGSSPARVTLVLRCFKRHILFIVKRWFIKKLIKQWLIIL